MTTSDSEDFESADEDIDPEYSKPKSKAEKLENESDTKKYGNSPKDFHPASSETLLKNTGETATEESSREPLCFPEVRNSEPVDKLEIKNECGAIDESENNQDNSSVNKPDVLQDSPEMENLKSRKHNSRRPDRAGKSQRVRESKSGPMKLGVRLTNQKVTVESSNGADEPEKDDASVSNPNEVSSDERTFHETEPFTSLVEKMSGMSTSAPDSEPKEEDEHKASQSSGWGFGKGLIGSGGLGSLGGWGTSLLNTATLSVSTLGSHVTQGISTVLETVEAGIGAPNPEELARKIKEEKENALDKENANVHRKETSKEGEDADLSEAELEMEAWGDWNDDDDFGGGDSGVSGTGLLSLVSGVTQVTGKVFSTGLDTLEVIGKKTMEVLQEGDPGLKKKRALLLGESDQVVLSQVLREAKEKAEVEAKLMEEKEAARKAHFETLFDDYQGLVHLEALEMLSKQCDLRLKGMLLKESGPALRGLQIRLAAVQEMCEIPDPDETEDDPPILSDVLPEALGVLKIEVSADKLTQCIKESYQNLEEMKSDVEEGVPKCVPRSIHQAAISSLATITAHAIEVFHKVTELLLVKDGKGREIKNETQVLVRVTTALTLEVNKIATEFSDFLSTKLNDSSLTADDKEKIESYITSIFLEASNSSTYIQDAFQLMVPVLQVGATA